MATSHAKTNFRLCSNRTYVRSRSPASLSGSIFSRETVSMSDGNLSWLCVTILVLLSQRSLLLPRRWPQFSGWNSFVNSLERARVTLLERTADEAETKGHGIHIAQTYFSQFFFLLSFSFGCNWKMKIYWKIFLILFLIDFVELRRNALSQFSRHSMKIVHRNIVVDLWLLKCILVLLI